MVGSVLWLLCHDPDHVLQIQAEFQVGQADLAGRGGGFLREAGAAQDVRRILDQFDVITCDSQIMYFATKFLGTPVQERVSGSDYFPRFYMHHKDNPEITVFLCGGKPGIAELARANINRKVGREMIVGTDAPAFDFETKPGEIDRMIAAINASGATVCLVGLGGGRQEKFIVKYRDRMPGVKLWLPLGGTIDYESGTFERPPAWITE